MAEFLASTFPEAEAAYQALKTVNDPILVDAWVAGFQRDTDATPLSVMAISKLDFSRALTAA